MIVDTCLKEGKYKGSIEFIPIIFAIHVDKAL